MSTPIEPSDSTRKSAANGRGQSVKVIAALALLIVAGYLIWKQFNPKPANQYNYSMMEFVDHAQSNTPLDSSDVGSLKFVDVDGKPLELKQFRGKNNVVLVVTRGNTSSTGPGYEGNICVYCATQTSRMIANYDAFRDHDAEVVVVFPIRKVADRGSIGQFQAAVRNQGAAEDPPFPLVLDIELHAVDQLGIRADLSKPATYILDKEGQVRFAYVGATIADRPSVQSMLEQLAVINADAK